MRQVALDTETTGLEPAKGHRVIELACVEIIERKITGNHFHAYFNPGRDVDLGAVEVHGITTQMLVDKPRFSECIAEFLAFIEGAEVIIHNAPFDVGFINHEFRIARKKLKSLDKYCDILDTLPMARQLYPGQKNSLDALCKRNHIDNSSRVLHGALLDAELLARVYLAMTGGQGLLSLDAEHSTDDTRPTQTKRENTATLGEQHNIPVIYASKEELASHYKRLDAIAKHCGQGSLWQQCETESV